jgi:cytochrome c
MKTLIAASVTLLTLAMPALANGDAEKGEKTFNQCKACHMIASEDETIVNGGRVGPNLYGVIGRTMGGVEDYNYSDGLAAKAEEDETWTEESLAEYVQDPSEFIGSRSKMTYKLRNGSEDVAAYLATVSN